MKSSFATLAVCAALGLAACHQTPPTAAAPDPVAELKAFAAKLQGPDTPLVRADVRKTDSLTAPFTGTLSGQTFGHDKNVEINFYMKFTLGLDRREGKWEFRECTGTIDWTDGRGDLPFSETSAEPHYASSMLEKLGLRH